MEFHQDQQPREDSQKSSNQNILPSTTTDAISSTNPTNRIDQNRSPEAASHALIPDAISYASSSGDNFLLNTTSPVEESEYSFPFFEENDIMDHSSTGIVLNTQLVNEPADIPHVCTVSSHNCILCHSGPHAFSSSRPLSLVSSDQLVNINDLLRPSSRSDHQSHNVNSIPSFDEFLIQELIRVAAYIEANNLMTANTLMANLSLRPMCVARSPLQRAAFYFKNALEALLHGRLHRAAFSPSPDELVSRVRAAKDYSIMSPVPKFAKLAAAQPILEYVQDSNLIHIIDFDFGVGDQWSPFMTQAERSCRQGRCPRPIWIRVTAVVQEVQIEAEIARQILLNMARSLQLRLIIEFVTIASLQTYAVGAFCLAHGEAIAVKFSPTIFRIFDRPQFFSLLFRLNPRIAVFEDFGCQSNTSPPGFAQDVAEGIHLFKALMESLDAIAGTPLLLADDYGIRNIEVSFIQPRILQYIAARGEHRMPWQDLFQSIGLVPVRYSEMAEMMAECMLLQVPLRALGYHLVKTSGKMMVEWSGRALVSVSAWRFGRG